MKTTVIHHSADYDGIFCREIARKFLPDAELIGWDFGDAPLTVPDHDGVVYVLDLPVDRPFGFEFGKGLTPAQGTLCHRTVWIDHHKSSIETHPSTLGGYRIDGVAACRLAWQWFYNSRTNYGKIQPENFGKQMDYISMLTNGSFVDRTVEEPLAVRLAGEYDIWDKRDPNAELFQHGLRSEELNEVVWRKLLCPDKGCGCEDTVERLLEQGRCLQYAKAKENESIITHQGFTVKFEGLTFLACNHARYNSFLFTAGLKPEHDACLGFKWDGKGKWSVSLYHAPGKEHHDLSEIAKKHGGGGHKGACGFICDKLPFNL